MPRPLAYQTVEELEAKIAAYFDYCDNFTVQEPEYKEGRVVGYCEVKRPKRYTTAGLARWLDCDRRTITNYEKREPFFPTISRAKIRIEEQLEECLYGSNVTGIIFNLKNNYGWRDKTEADVDLTTKGEKVVGINYVLPNAHNDQTDSQTASSIPSAE